jgi:hypothetical protein
MVHAFQLLFIDCNYPTAFVWWIGLHAVMFYFLFSDFYKQAYRKKAQRRVRSATLGSARPCLFWASVHETLLTSVMQCCTASVSE